MADEKFSTSDIQQNPLLISAKGDAQLSASSEELNQQLGKMMQLQQQNIQALISLLGQLQGRFPPETDQKLQTFLQQLNQQNQTAAPDISLVRQSMTESTQPSQHQHIVVTQLSQLLAKQPQLIPAVLTETGNQASAETLFKTLTTLINNQTPAWQNNQPLSQKAMDWFLQSNLALTSKSWPQLPPKIQTLLIQSGFSAPTTPLTTIQSQYIRQTNDQLFHSLAEQSSVAKSISQQIQNDQTNTNSFSTNVNTKTPINRAAQTSTQNDIQTNSLTKGDILQSLRPLAKMTQLATQQLQQIFGNNKTDDSSKINTKASENATAALKTTDISSANSTQEIKRNITELTQIVENQKSITQLKPLTESLNKILALLPKEDIRNSNPTTQLSTPLKTIAENPVVQIQQKPAEFSQNRMSMILENAIHQIKAKPDSLDASINRLGLYQLSPQLKTDIHRAKIAEVFEIPDNDESWEQLIHESKPIREQIQSLLQNLAKPDTQQDNYQTQTNAKNITADSDYRVNAITRETNQPLSKWQQLISLALKQNPALLNMNTLPDKNLALPTPSMPQTPINTLSTAQQLSAQISQPLQTPEQVKNWIQFLMQPLTADNAYSRSLQVWLVQLLQQKSQQKRASSEAPMIFDINEDTSSFEKLVKIMEHSVTQPRTPAQQTQQQSQPQMTPSLNIPLPPTKDELEQQQSFELRRNIRNDEHRGWQIAMNLDLGQRGKIRLQARMTLPDIALSVLAEKGETIDFIKKTYPILSERFSLYGLNLQKPILRQGKVENTKPESPTENGFSVKV